MACRRRSSQSFIDKNRHRVGDCFARNDIIKKEFFIMELALIGLGKMGLNMATRLVRGGHRVVGYARTAETVEAAVTNGAEGAHSLEEAVGKLKEKTRVVWVMVPSGQTT